MIIIFLGYAIPPHICDVQVGASIAGNNMQLGILRNLFKLYHDDLKIITVNPIAAYPSSTQKRIRRARINLLLNLSAIRVGFINIPIIKQFNQTISILLEIIRLNRRAVRKEKKVIICYNSNIIFSIPCLLFRRVLGVKICCLLVDPPLYDGTFMNRSVMKELFFKINAKFYELSIHTYDKLIVLNEYVVEYYEISKPYLVINGGLDLDSKTLLEPIAPEVKMEPQCFKLVFSGTLHEHSGILNLLEAMKLVEKDISLDIYGKGPYEKTIIEYANQNRNIHYYGFKKNEDILRTYASADLLICPNLVDHKINKVAFPSKLIEYMSSGRPVLSTDLNCIGEFKQYILVSKGDTASALAQSINEISKMDQEELALIGENAKEFIMKNKTWELQVRRIVDFILKEKDEKLGK